MDCQEEEGEEGGRALVHQNLPPALQHPQEVWSGHSVVGRLVQGWRWDHVTGPPLLVDGEGQDLPQHQ